MFFWVRVTKDVTHQSSRIRSGQPITNLYHCTSTKNTKTSRVKYGTLLYVPKRIKERWHESHADSYRFDLKIVLAAVNISAEEFKNAWKMVGPMVTDKELFRMFKKGFSVRDDQDSKAAFIKDIVRRHKAMGEPVCV